MNNSYYENPYTKDFNPQEYIMPNNIDRNQNMYPTTDNMYIDRVIGNNRGKKAKIYITVPGSVSWQDKEFEGIIEGAYRDHIVISNPNTGEWNIIPIIYLVYITLEEPINYN